jgi:hypothetical protein
VNSAGLTVPDDDRVVDFTDERSGFADDEALVPGSTRGDPDFGWGELRRDSRNWLIDERPPHWE